MSYTHYENLAYIDNLAVGKKGSEKVLADAYGRMYLNFEPGNQFYVDSGVDGTTGLTWDTAVGTIDEAIGLCTASNGDVIWVAPGHAESITGTDITVDIAGVTIIGLGKGSLMPKITYAHADAEISVTADNVYISGLHLYAAITGVKVAIEIEDGADYCTVKNCLFDVEETAVDEFLVSIRTNDASNNALIEDNYIDMGLGGAVAAISFTKDTDSTIVRGNIVQGDYSTACINGITTASTKLLIENNLLINGGMLNFGTEPAIELVTQSTGVIRDNDIVCNLDTMIASVVADECILFRNYYNEDVTPGTGTIMGTPSADG